MILFCFILGFFMAFICYFDLPFLGYVRDFQVAIEHSVMLAIILVQ